MRADAVWQAAKRIGGTVQRDFRSAFGGPGPPIEVSPLRAGEAVPGTVMAKMLTSLAAYSRAKANWRETQRERALRDDFLSAQTAQMQAKANGLGDEMTPYQRESLELQRRRLDLLANPPVRPTPGITPYQKRSLDLRERELDKRPGPQDRSRVAASRTAYQMAQNQLATFEQRAQYDAETAAQSLWQRLSNPRNDADRRYGEVAFGITHDAARQQDVKSSQARIAKLADRLKRHRLLTDPQYRALKGRLAPLEAAVRAEALPSGDGMVQDGSTLAEPDWDAIVRDMLPDPSNMEN